MISRRGIWLGIALTAVIAGGGTVAAMSASGDAPAPTGAAAPVVRDTGAAGALQDPVTTEVDIPRTGATATRVQIAAIGVDSSLEQLPLDPSTNELTPPVDWQSAGWYRDGTVPGDIGPAVIAGHVDSVTAPAVFARLGELSAGDVITVTLSDGSVAEFAVDRIETAPKNDFPTSRVYGPTPTAQLRVITCDGEFDGATGHYLDNLIVFASLIT